MGCPRAVISEGQQPCLWNLSVTNQVLSVRAVMRGKKAWGWVEEIEAEASQLAPGKEKRGAEL